MFWLKIGLGLLILYVLIWLMKFSLSKVFKIKKEKQDWFSYNHVNKAHKQVDWFIRILTLIVQMTCLYLVLYEEYSIVFFLVPLFLLLVGSYSVKAFFEWKFSDNPKQSILTIGEMVIFAAVLTIIIQFDLLNLGY